ncbi:hypothetical protein [Streptomyces regalis]|uniref:hypothetical protein n=1 Tax=Streptomyces regalis TaxID=68262 RepID=UPI000AB532B3|nr:hypothetical protein [Streptomyces regalis]
MSEKIKPEEPAAEAASRRVRSLDVLRGIAIIGTLLSTVKTHVQKLLAKLDVRTRVEAALIASRAGLVENGQAEPGN